MNTKRRGRKYLGYLIVRYLPMLILIMLMSGIDSATYTYISMFIKYIIAVLENNVDSSNTLPKFVISFFNSGQTKLIMITYAAFGLFLFQFIRAIFKFAMGFYRNYFSEVVAKKIRKDMYAHIQSLPYNYHNNVDTGDLIQRCTTDNETIKTSLCSQLPQFVSVFSIVTTAIFQMSKINTSLMMVSIIILPISIIVSIVYFVFVEKKFEEVEEEEAKLMSVIKENVSGVKVVKAFANEQFEKQKFEKQNNIYSQKNLRLNKISAIFWGLTDSLTSLQYLLTMVIAISLLKNNPGVVSASDVIAILMLVGTYVWPVRELGRIVSDIGKCSVAAGRIKEILDEKSEYKESKNGIFEITGEISFDNVCFKFDDSEEYLLKNLSFHVNPGETIAIIGKTGSGKSTIAKILTRLIDYNSGSIKLGSHELSDFDKNYIRKNVGLILQEPFLFARSVYDNIKITNPTATYEQIESVAKIASIEKDIGTFEKGYDTKVGEKGATLSGGQKQRLSIARMLLNEKPIIIFDDSLSAVDTQTDLQIRNALKEHNKSTTILITHRITSAKQADKIIVLENGTISAIGTHDELCRIDGLYKKLWDIQGESEKEFMSILCQGGDC